MPDYPIEVGTLRSIGQETINCLRELTTTIHTVHNKNTVPSSDQDVVDLLNVLMERIKQFKGQMDCVKQRNLSFLKEAKVPETKTRLKFNELLQKVHSEIQRIEIENAYIEKGLKRAECLHNLDILGVVDSAKRIGLTSNAPPDWDSSMSMWPYRPPYPTEDLIRSSRLFMKMSQTDKAEVVATTDHPTTGMQITNEEAVLADNEEDSELLKGLDISSL